MRGRRIFLAAAIVLGLAGCSDTYHYELEMRPDGDGLQRTLTVWRWSSEGKYQEYPEQSLRELAAVYGVEPQAPAARKFTFQGRFTGKTPADVGGAGWYHRLTSPLGDGYWYSERVGGDDDVAGQLERRWQRVDDLVGHLAGWFEAELGDDPRFAGLREFIEVDLRRDLRNVTTYAWPMGRDEEPLVEALPRIAHYFMERDYFGPGDLPWILRRANEVEHPFPWLSSMVLRKGGFAQDGGELPAELAFLTDEAASRASWERYWQTTDEYRQQLAEWEEKRATDPEAKRPDASDVLAEKVFSSFFELRLFADRHRVSMTMHLPAAPIESNGTWHAVSKTLTWPQATIEDEGPPPFYFATWSEPNEETQARRFGRVILTGEGLLEHVHWYNALTPEEADQWHAFLASLTPESDHKSLLEQFHFDHEREAFEDPEQMTPLSDSARRVLLEGLKVEK